MSSFPLKRESIDLFEKDGWRSGKQLSRGGLEICHPSLPAFVKHQQPLTARHPEPDELHRSNGTVEWSYAVIDIFLGRLQAWRMLLPRSVQ